MVLGRPFYGFLSNTHTAALVSPHGSVDWLPCPRFDGEALFCRILDRSHGGYCAVSPLRPSRHTQAYLPGTNVLQTTWSAPGGRARVLDYLVPGRNELRRAIYSEVPLRLACEPRFRTGAILPARLPGAGGMAYVNPTGSDALTLRIRGGGPAARLEGGAWVLPPGEHEVVLHYVRRFGVELPDASADAPGPRVLRRVVQFWRETRQGARHLPRADAISRSLLVIHGLTYRASGAMIAAPTTSLPEVVGQARQWDYRFAWVRDGSYAAEALLWAGDMVAVRRFIEFYLSTADTAGRPLPYPFLRVDGVVDLGERECHWLGGHQGSRPVRVGNGATSPAQLDLEGDFLWVVWLYYRATGDRELLREYWWAIRAMCAGVALNCRQPDASLWEFRSRPRRYTHTALMCWVALLAGANLGEAIGKRADPAAWRAAAEGLAREVLAVPSFRQRVRGGGVDAALLCLPLYGLVAASDPRWRRTLAAIERNLCRGDLVYRYAADPMGPARHPFLLCSFWLARAHLRAGSIERAERLIERALACRTDLGLWGEHHDVAAGRPRGNFPQLFSHAGFVTACCELEAVCAGRGLPAVAPVPGG